MAETLAGVNHEVLRWARERSGLTAAEVAYWGRKFLELAFGRYYQGRIDLEQLSDYLNVKARNIPKLEQAFMRKASAS